MVEQLVDDYEYADKSVTLSDRYNGDLTHYSITTTRAFEGNESLQYDGSGSFYMIRSLPSFANPLPNYPEEGETFGIRVYQPGNKGDYVFIWNIQSDAWTAASYAARFSPGSSDFQLERFSSSGRDEIFASSGTAGAIGAQWAKIEIVWQDDGNDTHTARLRDDAGNLDTEIQGAPTSPISASTGGVGVETKVNETVEYDFANVSSSAETVVQAPVNAGAAQGIVPDTIGITGVIAPESSVSANSAGANLTEPSPTGGTYGQAVHGISTYGENVQRVLAATGTPSTQSLIVDIVSTTEISIGNPTTLTVNTENPGASVSGTVTVNATELALATSTPGPSVVPAIATLTVPETVITESTPGPSVNTGTRTISIGNPTFTQVTNPNPSIGAATLQVQVPVTSVVTDTIAPGASGAGTVTINGQPTSVVTDTPGPTVTAVGQLINVGVNDFNVDTVDPSAQVSGEATISPNVTANLLDTPNPGFLFTGVITRYVDVSGTWDLRKNVEGDT